MKKTNNIRFVALLLALMMLCCTAVACANNNNGDDTTPADTTVADPSGSDTTVSGGTTEPELTPDLPEVSYQGEKITFLERTLEMGNNIDVYFNEFYADLSLAEPVSNAVYERNMAIVDKYGIEIESVRELNNDLQKKFTNAADAGDKICDVISANGKTTMSLAVSGYLRDINTLDYIDYDNPWWMGMAMDTSSISGKNAFILGDINIQMFTAVEAVYFNKQLVVDLGLDDIYTIVKEGDWTLDKMYEYCSAAVAELDGDNIMTDADRYGMIFNNHSWQPFFYGSGKLLVEKDAADTPKLMLTDDNVYDTLAKVIDFLADDEVMACSSWFSYGNMGNYFQAGHGMFYAQLMYVTLEMRQGELDFGILPVPKVDASQDEYYSYVHQKSSYTSVPKVNQDLDKTGIILEDMAYESYKLIRPAFFDVMLDGKVAKDVESTEMLDYLYENVYVCVLQAMSSVGLDADTVMRTFITNKTGSSTMSSTLKKNESLWRRTLGTVSDSFADKVE
ncbi:MAG: extracellular solute-binding protein [Clostridia bacterium]|nr:extracellular solute-binding protein [Clostridia bacterium]